MTKVVLTAEYFPNDLWEYLPALGGQQHSVFGRLPSRNDRDRLVKSARSAPEFLRRVQLWNYFFRIDAALVGQDQRESIILLKEKVDRGRDELSRTSGQHARMLQMLEGTLHDLGQRLIEESQRLERKAASERAALLTRARSKKIVGLVLLWFGGAICLGLGGVWLLTAHESSELSNALIGCLALGALLVTVPLFSIFGLLFLVSGWQIRRSVVSIDSAAQVRALEIRAQADTERVKKEIDDVRRQSASAEQEFQHREITVRQQILELEEQIQHLRAQVPRTRPPVPDEPFEEACRRIPSDDEAAAWLLEDIRELKSRALEETGLEGRIGYRVAVEAEAGEEDEESNVFCIPAPAEIQGKEFIPPSYLGRSSPDRAKHLSAKRFGVLADGSSASFHAVYNVYFIIIAPDVLAGFRTTWDFVDGEQRGEEARSQHFADVVGVQDYRGYREFFEQGTTGENTEMVRLDNAPTLRLSLTSSEILEVTWVSGEYYEKTNAPADFDIKSLFLDPTYDAVKAVKAVRQRVDDAKRKREWGETRGRLGGPK